MILDLCVHLHYRMEQPTDMLLQLEAAALPDQRLLSAHIALAEVNQFTRIQGEDGIGDRIWVQIERDLICDYTAQVELNRAQQELASLKAVPTHLIPAEVVKYLMPSRYCPVDEFQNFVATTFAEHDGGAKIAAIRDWIEAQFTYAPGCSNCQTTAMDTFVHRQGICRDFAHMLITLARASAIPARYASVYAPGVTPQDFHAVAEVYLDGGWHLVDPTGMADSSDIARIGVGQDAADVAFITSYGPIDLISQSVTVKPAESPASQAAA